MPDRLGWCPVAPAGGMKYFLAAKLPETVVRHATQLQTTALALPLADAARTVPVDLATKGHVTVHFLGQQKPESLHPLRLLVENAIQEEHLERPPRLWLRRALDCFPNRTVVVNAPVRAEKTFYRLQRAVSAAAVGPAGPEGKGGRKGRRKRPFRAHVTLARIHGLEAKQRKEFARLVEETSEKLGDVEGQTSREVAFSCAEVVLFESKQDADGKAVYEELWSVPVCRAPTA